MPSRPPLASPAGRFARRAVLVLLLPGMVSACSRPAPRPADDGWKPRPAVDRGLTCEQEHYPCAWSDVDGQVFDRSLELAARATLRMQSESIERVAAWLKTAENVAEVDATPTTLRFRLAGGRPMVVFARNKMSRGAPGRPLLSRQSTGRTRWSAGLTLARYSFSPPVLAPSPYVVGRDTDGNDRINQRDRRRALVLDPLHSWLGATDGEMVASIFNASPAYRGGVDLLQDQAAGLDAFRSWRQYDAIHVTSGGDDSVLVTGEHLAVAGLGRDEREALRQSLTGMGIAIAAVGDTTYTDLDSLRQIDDLPELLSTTEWMFAIEADFLRAAYPTGLDRTIVLINSPGSMSGSDSSLYDPLVPASHDSNDGAVVFGWTHDVDFDYYFDDRETVARTLWESLVGQGFNTFRAFHKARAAFADPYTFYGCCAGTVHRAREIIRLEDAAGHELRDGADLAALIDGEPGDGRPDKLNVVAKVDGIWVPDEGLIVDAGQLEPREDLHMEAWLELDGRRVGPSEGLWDKPHQGSVVTVPFAEVPLGLDVRPGHTYELEAVVLLPREADEDGDSRYSVKLAADSCAVPSQGDYEGDLTGDRARRIDPGSRGAFAKILASPLGGWALQLESRERGGRDLSMTLAFGEPPEAGTVVHIEDPGWADPGISGSVDQYQSGTKRELGAGLDRRLLQHGPPSSRQAVRVGVRRGARLAGRIRRPAGRQRPADSGQQPLRWPIPGRMDSTVIQQGAHIRSLQHAAILAGALAASVCGATGASDADPSAARPAVSGTGQSTSPAPKVLGTIRATLDGAARTWYVVSGTSRGRPYASGAWQDNANGRRTISIGGFDTATPPLDTFEWDEDGMPRSYGDYHGSALTLTLMLAAGSEVKPFRLVFPPERSPALMYASRATLDSLDTTFKIETGTVDVTAVSVADGTASAAGTFSGTLTGLVRSGAVVVSNGAFDVSGLPRLDALRRTTDDGG